MHLAFNLLLTLLVELPIIGFFFKKRKRKAALRVGLLINLVTWPIVNIIRITYPDWSLEVVEIGVVVLEGVAYWFFLGRSWTRAAFMAILANAASFIATKFIQLDPDFFQKKVNVPIH